MKSSVYVICLILLASSVSYAENFESKGWSGEGIPVLISIENGLRLYSRPEKVGVVSTIPYHQGWLVPFDKSLVRTLESEFLVAKQTATVEVYCGNYEKYELSAGDEVEILQYRAEGYYTARLEGRICSFPIQHGNELFGKLPSPKTEWWVRVVYADSTSPGWLLVDREQIAFGRRKF